MYQVIFPRYTNLDSLDILVRNTLIGTIGSREINLQSDFGVTTSLPNDRGLIPGTSLQDIYINRDTDYRDSYYYQHGFQYNHHLIKTPMAWEITHGTTSTIIASEDLDWMPLLNPSVIADHPDMQRWDPVANPTGNFIVVTTATANGGMLTSDLRPGHGLQTLSTAMALGNNDYGTSGSLIGVAWGVRGIGTRGWSGPQGQPSQINLAYAQSTTGWVASDVVTMSFISAHDATACIEQGSVVVAGIGNDLNPRIANTPDCGPNSLTTNAFGISLGTTATASGAIAEIFGPTTNEPGSVIHYDPAAPANPQRDFRVICVGATTIGEQGVAYGNNCQSYPVCDPNAAQLWPIQKRGVEQFMARFNYSPGVDKFNTSTDATVRIVAKQQAAMDLVAPTDVLVAADAANGSLHARKYTTDGGTSNAIPQVSGVAALMVSVHKHLGVDLDLNDDGIVDNGPEVQRLAHTILTFTTDKIQDFNNIPDEFEVLRCCADQHPRLYSFVRPPFYQYADYSAQDPLRRTWAPRMGFGRLNAYRAVAHTIANKGAHMYTTSATLPFTVGNGQIGNGLVNERGEMLMHFGSWRTATQAVLQAGGVSLPLPGEYHNNQGITFVNGSGTVLLVPNNSVLAIDGIVTTANVTGLNSIRSASGSNGRILMTGFLSNVEVAGNVRLADLYIHGANGGIGCVWMGDANSESHVYGKVRLLDDGMLFVNKGKGILQPGGELYMTGTKDVVVQVGAVLEMASASGVYGNTGRKLMVKSGSKLVVLPNADVDLLCHVEVEEGAEMVLSTGCTAEVQFITVQRGGTLVCQEGSNLILLEGVRNDGKFISHGVTNNTVRITGAREKCDWVVRDAVVGEASISMFSIPQNGDYGGSLASLRYTDFYNVKVHMLNTPTDPIEHCTFRSHRDVFTGTTMLTKNVLNTQGPAEVTGLVLEHCLFADDGGDMNGRPGDPDPAWRGDDDYVVSGVRVYKARTLTVSNSEFHHLMNGINSILIDDALITGNTFMFSDFGVHDSRSAVTFCNNTCIGTEQSQFYESSRVGLTYDNTYGNVRNSMDARSAAQQYMRNNTVQDYREGIFAQGSPIELTQYGILPDPTCVPTGYAFVENGYNNFHSTTATVVASEFVPVQTRDPNNPSIALQRVQPQQWDIALGTTSTINISDGKNLMGLQSGYHLFNTDPQPVTVYVSNNAWLDPTSGFAVRRNVSVLPIGTMLNQQDDTNPGCEVRRWCHGGYPNGSFPGKNVGDWTKLAATDPKLDALYTESRTAMLNTTLTSMERRIHMHNAMQAATLDDAETSKLNQLVGDYHSIANETSAPTEVRARALMMKGEAHERLGNIPSAITAYDEVMTTFATGKDSIAAAWRVQFLNVQSTDSAYGKPYSMAMAAWAQRVLADVRRTKEPVGTGGQKKYGAEEPTVRQIHRANAQHDALLAVAPNPFAEHTEVQYVVPQSGMVRLSVSDALGREVALLSSGEQLAGRYSYNFKSGDLPAGVYLLRLQSNGTVVSVPLVIQP